MKQHDVDIVHASESIPGAIASIAALATRHRVIFHRHHTWSKGAYLQLTRVAGWLSELTMAVSRSTRDAALSEGVRPNRVRVALNGIVPLRKVSVAETVELKQRLGIVEGHEAVVVIGHLRREKGHAFLFQVFDRLCTLRSNVHLIVVGTGPEKVALERAAESSKNSERIYLVGPQEDVALWYELADVVVVPSIRESFGLVAVEAMSAGRPLVASAVEGLREVIEPERSGLLAVSQDPISFSEALARVLSSPALAARLAQGGEDRFTGSFTLEAMVASWSSCYQELLTK
jgi:glycosyltransferase involved in cell wall biosynthesis